MATGDAEDEERFRRYGLELADAIEDAIPTWILSNVERLLVAYRGVMPPAAMEAAQDAATRGASDLGGKLRSLLDLDIDDQRTNPLALVRSAVTYPTGVLRDLGVPPVVRDPDKERLFPDDVYDLTPASFAEVDPSLHDLGMRWGAAKAYLHKARHGR